VEEVTETLKDTVGSYEATGILNWMIENGFKRVGNWRKRVILIEKNRNMSRVGFQPMPFRTSIWNWRLRQSSFFINFSHIQVFLSELHIFQRPFDIGLPTNYISFISSVCHLFIIIMANSRVAYSWLFRLEVHELIFLRQPLADVALSH
jgi:hypothetical protein